MPALRTAAEARKWFEATGTTVASWARAHGFATATVYALLSGRTRGRHGDAHKAAIALQLKPPVTDVDNDQGLSRAPSSGGRPIG